MASTNQKKKTAAELGKVKGFYIPADISDWMELTSKHRNLQNSTINTLNPELIGSASTASEAQYLMLRSYLIPTTAATDFVAQAPQLGFTSSIMQSATEILQQSGEWSFYLDILQTDGQIDYIPENDPRWSGTFSAVRRPQEQVMTVDGSRDRDRMAVAEGPFQAGPASQSRRPMSHRAIELPEGEDEASVNAAVIVLLQSISHLVNTELTNSGLEWVNNRVHLTCRVKRQFNAYTDGALRTKQGNTIFSIVEAKKRSRYDQMDKIIIQETCQVASWHTRGSPER